MTPYQSLRAALEAELAQPGHVTRAELRAVLDRHPAEEPPTPPDEGDFADGDFDPSDFH